MSEEAAGNAANPVVATELLEVEPEQEWLTGLYNFILQGKISIFIFELRLLYKIASKRNL